MSHQILRLPSALIDGKNILITYSTVESAQVRLHIIIQATDYQISRYMCIVHEGNLTPGLLVFFPTLTSDRHKYLLFLSGFC